MQWYTKECKMEEASVRDAQDESPKIETRLFLDGIWQQADSRFALLNKYDGTTIAEVSAATPETVQRAVAGLAKAFAASPPEPVERAQILYRAAALLREEAEAFAATYRLESGFTQSDSRAEVARCIETLTLSAEAARQFERNETVPLSGAPGPAGRLAFVLRVPLGPVAAITPFNAPLNTVAHKLAPAIAAGNPVLLKPSSSTPLCGAALVDLLLRAGWPGEFIALLQGSAATAEAILADPRIEYYAFTGSTEVGRKVQAAAGLRRCQLELGAISFTLLEPDADLSKALPAIRNAAFRKAGQVCTSVQIVLAQEAIVEAVAAGLTALTEATPYGDPALPETLTGPMISQGAAEAAKRRLDQAVAGGAKLLAGGGLERAVLAPTLLRDAPADSVLLREEMFAPVMTLAGYGALDEAFRRVNATPYGLATGIFTQRIDNAFAAARSLRVGSLHINNTSSSRVDLMPYGGVKDSGFGKEGPAYAMREMSEERLITFTP
ncbi:MAG: aldehyde dehydrogenase family protein [Rhodospirillales bacterium]